VLAERSERDRHKFARWPTALIEHARALHRECSARHNFGFGTSGHRRACDARAAQSHRLSGIGLNYREMALRLPVFLTIPVAQLTECGRLRGRGAGRKQRNETTCTVDARLALRAMAMARTDGLLDSYIFRSSPGQCKEMFCRCAHVCVFLCRLGDVLVMSLSLLACVA
jgi:hypothetical protein